MAKLQEKQKAISLRLQGKSYNDIKRVLGVSKSTLSLWLRDHPLSPQRMIEVRDLNEKRIRNYKETRRKQREALLESIYIEEKKKILPLSKRDLLVAGTFLYWGEGAKTKLSWFSLSNNDPVMIKFFVYWLRRIFDIPRAKIKIRLHLYKDMDIQQEVNFWLREIGITRPQILKPHIKKSNRSSISYKGFGHGTCNVIVSNANLSKRILMGLKSVRDYFSTISDS